MSENGQVTPDVTEEERRRRPVGAWLRISIAGAAVMGIGAGLTSALWTDQVAVEIKGDVTDALALWVRPHLEDGESGYDTVPGQPGEGSWAKSVNLDFDHPVEPGESYTIFVDVYNASNARATVASEFENVDLPQQATIRSNGAPTIEGQAMATYEITLTTDNMPLSEAGREFSVSAIYKGTDAP